MKEDFYIGKWLIQPQLNQVVSGGKSVRIKPRSMLVLVNLAKADGEVVNKYDLMDAVWGQSVVTEDVLTQSIVELRKAFGDSASDPRMIETIRRVGFRLLQPVTEGSSAKRSLFAELKRRNVVKVAIAYFIVGWLVIEIASVFLPTFEAPDWIMKVFSFLVVLGFPLAMIFSWAFELTPEGIRRDRRPEAD
ncbi:MAG TPA: winged helix-turn-helix domain-containing protein, partial [Xanthomonadales bacterium]|nr:winged helix-turn-helix domain-containing protein [Xanthomonadales bacterium]